MQWLERKLFPNKVAQREQYQVERERQKAIEEEILSKQKEIYSKAEQEASNYLQRLPSLPHSDILTLNENTGTTIQIYQADAENKLALIVPGYNSTGQKLKYNLLISDLLRHNTGVIRINNIPLTKVSLPEWDDGHIEEHQQKYAEYMNRHFQTVSSFLTGSGVIKSSTDVHMIGTSAGASAVLGLHKNFAFELTSLTLLGPSGDVSMDVINPSLENYLMTSGKLCVLSGQFDRFKEFDPYLTLCKLSKQYDSNKLSVAIATGGDHPLDNGRNTVQLAIHRESFRSLGLPYEQFDQICGDYPYLTFVA